MDGLFKLFNPSLPLHLLKGDEHGIDIHLFDAYVTKRTGIRPRFITPTDLRLVPCPDSKTGFSLHCVAAREPSVLPEFIQNPTQIISENGGELLEPIHQVGLELHQHELRALPVEVLRNLALCCFNDMRTIFLVHDKRMLGVVLQELEVLVHKYHVLTDDQAKLLHRGIAMTIIPGSQELNLFIQQCNNLCSLKDDFILKPTRSGKGDGIAFGVDLTPDEWISRLEALRSATLVPADTKYVVQRRINQPVYDLLLRENDGLQRNRLVGTYHAIHGKFLGLGIWRSSPSRVCAVSLGGAWMCSVTPKGGQK